MLVTTLLAVAGLQSTAQRDADAGGESYALLLLAACGALVLCMAQTTLAGFIGLELLSLAIYAAIGTKRGADGSAEALYKYFIQGAVFSALYLYGAALHYGATGSFAFAGEVIEGREAIGAVATLFMCLGLLFKVGVVPFHFWSPDAYAGSPVAVTAFMAGVVKIGGFALLASVLLGSVAGSPGLVDFSNLTFAAEPTATAGTLVRVLTLLALLSLLFGNVGALTQTRLRRLMAYSSIAHAGYLLLGLIPVLAGAVSLGAFAFYLVAYAVATTGATALLGHATGMADKDDLSVLSGVARQRPLFGIAACLLLASLAGLPPTAGFIGKFWILSALVEQGHVATAAFAMLMAVIGAVYYFTLCLGLWKPATVFVRPMPRLLGVTSTLALAVIFIIAWLPFAFQHLIG